MDVKRTPLGNPMSSVIARGDIGGATSIDLEHAKKVCGQIFQDLRGAAFTQGRVLSQCFDTFNPDPWHRPECYVRDDRLVREREVSNTIKLTVDGLDRDIGT